MPEGYINLHRKLVGWGWYKDSATKDVFLHMLLTANWHDGEYLGHPILRGQCVFGRKKFAEDLGISEQSVRTAINHLKSTGEITIKATNKFSVITIVKYSDYQVMQCEPNQQINQPANQRLTNDQPTTNHIQKGNKVKRETNKHIGDLLTGFSSDYQSAFIAFSEMRTKIKKPLTYHAAELAIKKLFKLSPNEQTQIAILNQSVLKCWQDVYPLKDDQQQSHSSFMDL